MAEDGCGGSAVEGGGGEAGEEAVGKVVGEREMSRAVRTVLRESGAEGAGAEDFRGGGGAVGVVGQGVGEGSADVDGEEAAVVGGGRHGGSV